MSTQTKPKTIGITAGDPGGVGAEVLLRALEQTRDARAGWPILRVFGERSHFDAIAQRFALPPLSSHNDVEYASSVIDTHSPYELGALTQDGAQAQVGYIREALSAIDRGDIAGIVTGPINKQALAMCDLPYHGHTEWLEAHAGVPVAMMLAGPILRTVPVTVHIPLANVPDALSTDLIFQHISLTHKALQEWFGIPSPRIAICGLNPHAGDGGLLGAEDEELIVPAIRAAQLQGWDVSGPFPGDTACYFAYQGAYDSVIGMYHDQALAPLKLVHFEEAVNVTLGLPFIRTSVDHGTAYDIAPLGKASSVSMQEALKLAVASLS
jgi:4-hydroxythreonine-4-phosphate dehydrogenase